MGQREIYLDAGFSYTVRTKQIKGKSYTDFTVMYYDIEIYNSSVNLQINCDNLFVRVCEDFYKNTKDR